LGPRPEAPQGRRLPERAKTTKEDATLLLDPKKSGAKNSYGSSKTEIRDRAALRRGFGRKEIESSRTSGEETNSSPGIKFHDRGDDLPGSNTKPFWGQKEARKKFGGPGGGQSLSGNCKKQRRSTGQ